MCAWKTHNTTPSKHIFIKLRPGLKCCRGTGKETEQQLTTTWNQKHLSKYIKNRTSWLRLLFINEDIYVLSEQSFYWSHLIYISYINIIVCISPLMTAVRPVRQQTDVSTGDAGCLILLGLGGERPVSNSWSLVLLTLSDIRLISTARCGNNQLQLQRWRVMWLGFHAPPLTSPLSAAVLSHISLLGCQLVHLILSCNQKQLSARSASQKMSLRSSPDNFAAVWEYFSLLSSSRGGGRRKSCNISLQYV